MLKFKDKMKALIVIAVIAAFMSGCSRLTMETNAEGFSGSVTTLWKDIGASGFKITKHADGSVTYALDDLSSQKSESATLNKVLDLGLEAAKRRTGQ